MTDVLSEPALTIQEAAKRFRGTKGRDSACVQTVRRWIKTGCRGVKLDSYRQGQLVLIPVSAIQRFIDAMNPPTIQSEPVPINRIARNGAAAIERIRKEHRRQG